MTTQSTVIVDALAARFGGTAYAAIQTSKHLALDERIREVVVVATGRSIGENR